MGKGESNNFANLPCQISLGVGETMLRERDWELREREKRKWRSAKKKKAEGRALTFPTAKG